MTAEEAVRYLEEKYADEPTVLDTEDALEAIEEALTLAYKTIKGLEWEIWHDGAEYCVFCHTGKHLGHSRNCSRQLALASIRESDESPED